MPSFVHVFSFILLTAALFSETKRSYLTVCIFWASVDSLFELGQWHSALIIKIIPNWFMGIPVLGNTADYFRKGKFDLFDLVAILAEAVVAYLILSFTTERE